MTKETKMNIEISITSRTPCMKKRENQIGYANKYKENKGNSLMQMLTKTQSG